MVLDMKGDVVPVSSNLGLIRYEPDIQPPKHAIVSITGSTGIARTEIDLQAIAPHAGANI